MTVKEFVSSTIKEVVEGIKENGDNDGWKPSSELTIGFDIGLDTLREKVVVFEALRDKKAENRITFSVEISKHSNSK